MFTSPFPRAATQEKGEKDEYLEEFFPGVPVMVQWLTNLTMNHVVAGAIPGLTQRVNDLALP